MSVAKDIKFGSKESKALALRFVLKNKVAFREFYTPQVYKRRYWHRHSFTPVLTAAANGDTFFGAGRGSGKSFAVLEPEIIQDALTKPSEETLLTSFRKIHIVDRMERAIDYLEGVPFLRLFLKRILRSPSYIIELYNAHMIYGISVGDDPEARMAQGKHASKIIGEEFHQFPMRAWMKLQGAQDPRGCTYLLAGVPDGRMDTPFRKAGTQYDSFSGRRIYLSRRLDPYWNQKTKEQLSDVHGSETSDTFGQEVDAKWGMAAWGAWDLDAIARCVIEDLDRIVLDVSGKEYHALGLTPSTALRELPGPRHPDRRRRMSMDVGYSQPSVVGIWEEHKDRWQLIARVNLKDRLEHDEQAVLVNYIGVLYDAEQIAIDTTEGEGRAIAKELEDLDRWAPVQLESGPVTRILRVTMNETAISGYTPEGEEVWDTVRAISTATIRRLVSHVELGLPRDEDIFLEFSKEKEVRGGDGVIRVVTPADVHITDMFRVKAFMVFLDRPPLPPDADDGNEWAFPEWGRQNPFVAT